MGRYIPPASQDPALSSQQVGGFNSQKGHPLGSRFSKAKDGIITVRFEIPFDVWCEMCKPEFLIKQGIRFNAQKKKAGNYMSTPIWEFSMRHPPCGSTIAIKTDPENTQYIVSAGGRKKAGAPTTAFDKDYGEILTEAERERRRKDAFAHLEGQNEENVIQKTETTKIRALYQARDRHWDDPYTANQKLRYEFRAGRKEREASEQNKEDIADRYGLGFDLLDHVKADADRAALVDFGMTEQSEDRGAEDTLSKPIFPQNDTAVVSRKPSTVPKTEWAKEEATRAFQRSVITRTNAKKNPFGQHGTEWAAPSKRRDASNPEHNAVVASGLKRPASPIQEVQSKCLKLVTYDSDEDT